MWQKVRVPGGIRQPAASNINCLSFSHCLQTSFPGYTMQIAFMFQGHNTSRSIWPQIILKESENSVKLTVFEDLPHVLY